MIPDAVAAVIAATIRDHPGSTPEAVARSAVAALDREGWHIVAPDTARTVLRAA